MEQSPLHVSRVHKQLSTINRAFAFIHSIALLAFLFYRASNLFVNNTNDTPMLAWALIFMSELLLSFLWLLGQPFKWRPVFRTVFPERLPENKELPPIDAFICTADPKKEPTIDVMNTVLSAMSLDYPPEKLSVYLSDDAGSSLTLYAIKEGLLFAKLWLSFCRMYGLKTRCPQAYFSDQSADDHFNSKSSEFMAEREKMKSSYELFKERVERAIENGGIGDTNITSGENRSPHVEVIHDNKQMNVDDVEIPRLVYVSREKKNSHHHHFKAGALNVLLRVSGIISNSPYILVLDCDMYCNDPTSARQAMCFHLDPKISQSLAFVQFPQDFHNISKNDIYCSQLRNIFKVLWNGMDGLTGPILSGTCFYIKRKALYGSTTQDDIGLAQLKQCFGPSNEFLTSLRENYEHNVVDGRLLQEAQFLATCIYEKQSLWGEQIGFFYHSLVEDFLTGLNLHCKRWNSVYYCPSRPAFLGSATTNLNDILVQDTRWQVGLLQVGFSRFCPLAYGVSKMSILQSMCYGYMAFRPLYSFALLVYASLPQLCLLNGIPLYPKISNTWFAVVSIVYVSSLCQHLSEVLLTGGSFRIMWNEQRTWMIKSVTCYLFACLDVTMKWIGIKEVNFVPTNKVVDKEQVNRYEMGKFDFQVPTMLLLPLTTLVIVNIASLVGGIGRMIIEISYDEMFGQVFLSLFILMASYPIIEGMILRKDRGHVPTFVTLLSTALAMIFLSFGSIILIR